MPAHRLADLILGSRVLSLIALTGGAATLVVAATVENLFVPGRGPVIVGLVVGVLFLFGIVLLLAPRRAKGLHTALMVTGAVIWAVLRWAFTDPGTWSDPIFVCIPAVTAGLFLGRRGVAVTMVLVVPAVAFGLAATLSGAELAQAVFVHSSLANLLAFTVYRTSRRADAALDLLWSLSNQDPLTGLANRRQLEHEVPALVADGAQAGEPICAVAIDLDHFKQANDGYGHAAGDEILVAVAAELAGLASATTVVARMGGEEFVVLARLPCPDAAAGLAETAYRRVVAARGPTPVTASIGVATAPARSGLIDPLGWTWALIDLADGAMYGAKQAGRARVVHADVDTAALSARPPAAPAAADGGLGEGHLRRACPTPRHLADERHAASSARRTGRGVGWAALGGAVVLLGNPLVGGLVPLGWAGWMYVAGVGSLVLLGLFLLRRPRQGARLVPLLPLASVGLWFVVQSTRVDSAGVPAASSTLLPIVIAAVWFTGLRSLVVTLAAVPVVLYALHSGTPHAVQTATTGAVVTTLIALLVLALRRRNDRLLEAVRALSTVDSLTGLANRRHLEEHACTLVALCAEQERPLALLQIDLDHFKQVNDTWGHAAGDEVLRALGRAMPDVLGCDDAVARTGGEEVVLLALVDDERSAMALAQRVRALVAHRCSTDAFRVTCSIGVATQVPPPATDAVAWLWALSTRADAALYEAKARGRNRCAAAGDVAAVDRLPGPRRGLPAVDAAVGLDRV